jgi:hypothetical protein
MNHIILLGDSIFDNGSYVAGGPCVIEQVQGQLPASWQATLLAVDGDTTVTTHQQLLRLPEGSTHLVLSVGGNDALGWISSLNANASSVMQALVALSLIQSNFESNYRSLVTEMKSLNIPLMICTIYDSIRLYAV